MLDTASVSDPSETGKTFCIQAHTPAYVGIGYETGTWSDPDAPASLATANERAAAVQASIWYCPAGSRESDAPRQT